MFALAVKSDAGTKIVWPKIDGGSDAVGKGDTIVFLGSVWDKGASSHATILLVGKTDGTMMDAGPLLIAKSLAGNPGDIGADLLPCYYPLLDKGSQSDLVKVTFVKNLASREDETYPNEIEVEVSLTELDTLLAEHLDKATIYHYSGDEFPYFRVDGITDNCISE